MRCQDRDKINAYLTAVHDASTPTPEVSSEEAKDLLNRFFVEVAELVNRYSFEAEKLGVDSSCPF